MNKLRLWNAHSDWASAEAAWEDGARKARQERPIKGLSCLPNMPGMTPETAKHLKWKSLKWMVKKDKGNVILKHFLKHPLRYGKRFLASICKKKPFVRDGDFFLYGISSVAAFKKHLYNPHALFVVGFSYCHKPLECPSGRFNDSCIHDLDNPVCRQCFIGKAAHALPEQNTVLLIIPTIHYVGSKIFELVHQFPDREILFLITACEMTLEMFGDFGNMAGIRGIGVRLDGRICNTMRAFELSEEGIKPGLTVVLDETQKRMLELIRLCRELSRIG